MSGTESNGEILVVDDNPDTLSLLSEMLATAGYVTRVAPSGELALWSAARKPPDLVVLDVRMPGMNGFEVCRCLKRQEDTAAVPVIFLSASADPDDRIEGFEAGGVDFVGKPYVESEVLARIRTHMRMSLSAKRLRLRAKARAMAAPSAVSAESKTGGEILIVEDTPASLQLLSAVLREAGYAVREAPNGELALWTTSRRPPDLILLDIRMPGMNGFDVCRCLKLDPSTARIPVIFISALSDSEDKAEGFAVGAVDYITKPFAENEVLARVKTHLRLAAAMPQHADCEDADQAKKVAALPVMMEAFAASASALAILDADGRIAYCNDAFTRASGYANPDGNQERPLFQNLFSDSAAAPAIHPYQAFRRQGHWSGEAVLHTRAGSRRSCHVSLTTMTDQETRQDCCIAVIHDLSRKPADESVNDYLMRHDVRTGLPSRSLATEGFARLIGDKAQVTVFLVSIGGAMAGLIATPGEAAINQLRIQVIGRIRSLLGAGDILYRENDETFVIVLGGKADRAVAGAFAARMLDRLGDQVAIQEKVLQIHPRIAIAFHPGDGSDLAALVGRAMTALDQAPIRGNSSSVVFAGDIPPLPSAGVPLDVRLQGVLERAEITILYQPVFALAAGRLVAVEALLRWNASDVEVLLPEQFLDLAAATGEIVPIGRWALGDIGRQLAAWYQTPGCDLRVVVNLSSLQFWQDDLPDNIAEVLRRHRLPPGSLEFDITAETLLEDLDQGMAVLRRLKALRVRVALDNFVALSDPHDLLYRLPIDCLKLGSALIARIENNDATAGAIRGLVDKAHRLQIAVVGRGVETAQQLALLKRCGVDLAQGYWLAPPMGADECRAAVPLHHG